MSWQLDPAHSLVEFTVRHMMVTNVRGKFEKFQVNVDFDESDPAAMTVDVTLDAASITRASPTAIITCARRISSTRPPTRRSPSRAPASRSWTLTTPA